MNENPVDISKEMSYNSTNENMIVVKMEEQKPVNDTTCRHDTLVPDPEDTLGDAVYHGCANYKCGVGFYIKK